MSKGSAQNCPRGNYNLSQEKASAVQTRGVRTMLQSCRAAELDRFALDLLNWFIASDKAVMWPFKFSGGDAAVVEDALPVCFYCFLDVESKCDRYLYPYEGVLQAKDLHMGVYTENAIRRERL
jgi:hypothetical protein